MNSFEIKGLKEFEEKLKTVEKKAPDRIARELDKQGNKLRRKAKENTPKGKTGNLQNGYKLTKTEKERGGYSKGLYNKAPHHHLVHDGHRKVSQSGKVLGWTDGVFYIDKTVAEQEPVITGDLKKWLDTLYEELK